EFTLYEDDGQTNNYEKGEFCKTLFSWNNQKRTLTIENIGGNMLVNHKMHIIVYDNNKQMDVNYNGKKLKKKF
ncbi:MAG: DUF5110 domain-containing protein, partial [Bacteroidales bacterium]|nr:DUF5110 domain-containing protein [Bacteroidales bacterium]